MGLAQADAAIQEQRVEALAGRLGGHAPGAGMGEFVRLADDEIVEGEARVERCQADIAAIFGGRVGARFRPVGSETGGSHRRGDW